MDFKKLIGITIQDVIVEESNIYDDDPSIIIHADNGSKYRIEGGYGEDTGESAHEFRTTLTLTSLKTSSASDTLKTKKRGVRLIYGNNQRREFDTIVDMIVHEMNSLHGKDITSIIGRVDAKTLDKIIEFVRS